MDISAITGKDIIFLGLDAASREETLTAIIDGISGSGKLSDKEKYRAAVSERERKGTTGIGFGVAIPHGKSEGVASPFVAFAKLNRAVDWDSFDGKPVSTVFMIGVPDKNASNDHLKILIAISKKLMHDEFRAALESAETADDILNVLKSIES